MLPRSYTQKKHKIPVGLSSIILQRTVLVGGGGGVVKQERD